MDTRYFQYSSDMKCFLSILNLGMLLIVCFYFERIGGFQNMAFDEVDISLWIIDWIPMPDPMVPGILNLQL